MDDLISRASAESIFRNARKALMEQDRKEHIKDFNTRDLMLLNAEQMIHLLPSAEKTGRWIPVSERLPEEYGEYLITWTGMLGEHCKKRSKPLIGIAEFEIYEPENYADWITTMYEFEHYHDIEVIAWMPLPEPYKAQEGEQNEIDN